MTSYDTFFSRLSDESGYEPHDWQRDLAAETTCSDALIRIPTGFGKTLGVLGAWAWNRVHRNDDAWPRRLIWCLPMRVLVEQTEDEVCRALEAWKLDCKEDKPGEEQNQLRDGKVAVQTLMGGVDGGDWHRYPERNAVLIGTQDMLLSRALNRGYAAARARWPMDFGLLNQDALWVMDEVQLMDVGLATSAQLQAFRREDERADKSIRPCRTWWMSATLQTDWLAKSPDTQELAAELGSRVRRIGPEQRRGHLWDDVAKPLTLESVTNDKALAKRVAELHRQQGGGASGPTLVVVNTVDRATQVWEQLKKDQSLADTDIRLAHSRFRPMDRAGWRDAFLNKAACAPDTDRIIVATQVIEAGVDLSAALLVTELAPWASLVQRFGRCARWGGQAQVVVMDFDPKNERQAAPYDLEALKAVREACGQLQDVAPLHLETFEETHAAWLPHLYPYDPAHLLLRHELEELFDTTPDLSGADIDISRFIRTGEERDVQVFWDDIPKNGPDPRRKPVREELCRVPFLKAQDWLCKPKVEGLKEKFRAWIWDWQDGKWCDAKRWDLYPGQTVLVDIACGGYDPEHGWRPDIKTWSGNLSESSGKDLRTERPCWRVDKDGWRPGSKTVRVVAPEDHADAAEDDESLSIIEDRWQTIAGHGRQVGDLARKLAVALTPEWADLLHLAGRWHDSGKAHPAFQSSIQADARPERDDLAKALDAAWPCSPSALYRIDATDQRRGFRHELASALSLFAVLQRHQPGHPALLGPWKELLGHLRKDAPKPNDIARPNPLEREVLTLDAHHFNLLAYLVCAHHGKVRVAWHAGPADQKAQDSQLRIRGVRDGDLLPPIELADADGNPIQLPGSELDLSPAALGLSERTGSSWSERVLGLLTKHGPFTLAWLEVLLRAADQRASSAPDPDLCIEADKV